MGVGSGLRGVWPQGDSDPPPLPEMATAAVRTHPTGMHSYLKSILLEIDLPLYQSSYPSDSSCMIQTFPTAQSGSQVHTICLAGG